MRNTRTRRPRQDRRGGHFTTRRSSFLASRSRSWLPRSSRSRALPPRWSASSMKLKRRSPISTRNSTKPSRRRRSDCLDGTLTLAAMSTRLCRGRRSAFSARISHPDRAPQPDGELRVYGGVGGRWTPDRLRQDARRSELPQICMQHLRPRQREGACFVSIRRRRLRCGPQAKLRAVPGGAGCHRLEAIGQGRAHAAADVHDRLSSPDDPDLEPREPTKMEASWR